MMKTCFGLCGLVFALLSNGVAAKPQVLSSLRPLSLIVQEIGGNSIDVDTLLPVTASHHDYPLKASDYVRLQKADLVLWIGPELESFLAKPLANVPGDHVLSAYGLTGIFWPPAGGNQELHHHAQDPHLWLDPRNAVTIAREVSARLIKLDSGNRVQYEANLQNFAAKMAELDNQIALQLKPVASKGFVVYHEGFSHFVYHYGLNELDYMNFTPEQKSGAKHLQQMREKLSKEGVCLFTEPYNEPQSAQALAQELHLRVGLLDAMGSQNISSYAQLLSVMANAFSACLADGRGQRAE